MPLDAISQFMDASVGFSMKDKLKASQPKQLGTDRLASLGSFNDKYPPSFLNKIKNPRRSRRQSPELPERSDLQEKSIEEEVKAEAAAANLELQPVSINVTPCKNAPDLNDSANVFRDDPSMESVNNDGFSLALDSDSVKFDQT